MLPVAKPTPTEVVSISPESLEIANCYLQLQDMRAVSSELDIPISIVSEALNKREVKAYIDNVFFDIGYNNRFKIRQAMDAIIAKKFQDMDEAEMGSGKDIADLLALSHKMSIEYLSKQIEMEKLRQQNETNIRSQTNIQINDNGGTNYTNLLNRLLETE
jgi:hypothetical protein